MAAFVKATLPVAASNGSVWDAFFQMRLWLCNCIMHYAAREPYDDPELMRISLRGE